MLADRRIPPGVWQGIILVVAVVFAFGLDYLFNLAAGRLLTPAEFSIVVALAAIGQILVVGSRVIQTVVTRFISRFEAHEKGGGRTTSFFHSMFRAAWRWGAVALIIALLLSYPIARFLNIEDIGPVLALAVATMFMVVRPVVGGTLQGIQRFGALGSVQVIQAAARLILGVSLILLGWGAFGAVVALPVASALALIFGWFVLRRALPAARGAHHGVKTGDLFYYSSFAAIGLIGFAMLINMDAILVRRFFDPVQAGHYSAAITLGKVIQFFPLAIIMLLFPKAAQRHDSHRDPATVLAPAMAAVIVVCGGIALIYFLFADVIVEITLGPEYQVDGQLLGLVGLAMLLLSLSNVWLNYFLSTERTRFVYLIGLALILQVALMVAFHEELWQLPAAMIVSGVWLTLAGTGIFWASRRQRRQVT